ncbi:MAG TPA: porin [Gemmatimonadales bacterium]|nr:porin [Gemmatimonadales bacterium]
MRSSSAIAFLMLCSGPRLAAQTPAPVSTTPKLSGYVQARFQSIGDSAVFSLRRVRLGAQGNLTSWASYKVQAELRSGGTGATAATVAATDLYLALTHRLWTATIGQSKTPLSAEFIRSSTVFELPEHSMAVDSLSPNRDVGVKLEWNTARTLALQGGVFNGDGINRAANRDKRFLYMGRAVVRAAKGAYLGVSAAAKPDTTTWDAEAWVERGRVAVRGEFLARHRSVAAVTTLGWYALGAYGVVPKRLQLVGRVQQFDPNDRAGADRVTGYTGGVQYFFSGDDLKLQLEYTIFDEQGPSLDNNRVILQMQARW